MAGNCIRVKMMKGLVFDIRRFTVHDGPGIRSTVFLKGCPLSCSWCHNPESQSGLPETSTKIFPLEGRKFREEEVSGKWMTVEEVLNEVEKDRVFYDESGGGVTISGGEPTFQPEFLLSLFKALKSKGLHTALDTCGYTSWENLSLTMNYADLYLYDLKLLDDKQHFMYTGVSNKLILDNMQKLARSGKRIIVRLPVIPGISDTDEFFSALRTFLGKMKPEVKEISLLPYHAAAANKYKRFGKENLMKNVKSIPKEALFQRKSELEAMGYSVKIGG